MNRQQRRANKKKNGTEKNGGHSAAEHLAHQIPGAEILRDGDKTKVSIPLPDGVKTNIADNAQYLADFEKAKQLLDDDELAESTQILNRLLKQNPMDYGVYELLGVASEKLKNYDAALQFFNAARQRQPDKHVLDVRMANLLVKTDKIDDALTLLSTLLNAKASALTDEEKAAAYEIIGNAQMLLGDSDAAKENLKTACDLSPDNLENLYNYISQVGKPQSEDDPYYLRLKTMEADGDDARDAKHNALLYYTLFDCYDSLKQHEKAFDYALKGASFKRTMLKNNPEKSQILFDGITDYFDSDFFAQNKDEGCPADTPIFIVGMPRSGTTLLEQILQSHPDVEGVGEDALLGHLIKHYSLMDKHRGHFYPLRFTKEIQGYFTPADIGQKYADYLAQKLPDAKRVINKAIGNILHLGYLRIALPNARFIHIKRNAMDSCLSSFTKNFADTAQGYSYDLAELGTYYRRYTDLMEHWNTVLPGEILNIEYEDIVDNLEDKARQVIDFIGLPWDERCLEFHKTESVVRTASIAQVRKPIYKSSVGRWKRYGPKVIPLIEALGHAAPPDARAYMKEKKQER